MGYVSLLLLLVAATTMEINGRFSEHHMVTMKKLTHKTLFLRNESTHWSILELGAGFGYWSEMMKKEFFPQASYFVVEGNKLFEPYLKKLSFGFAIDVVGDKDNELVDFYYTEQNPIDGSILHRAKNNSISGITVVKMSTTTIDSIILKHSVKAPQLMKMDLQGAEYRALLGAKNTLKTVEILIVKLAFHQYNAGAATFTDVNFFLESLEFRIYDISDLMNSYLRHERNKMKHKTAVQFEGIWVKRNSPFFLSSGFPESPPAQYTCTLT